MLDDDRAKLNDEGVLIKNRRINKGGMKLRALCLQKKSTHGATCVLLIHLPISQHHSVPTSHFLNSGDLSLLTIASSSVGGFSFNLTLDFE